MLQNDYENQLQSWIDQKKSALELSLVASKMSYDRAIDLVLFRRKLVDRTVPEILNDHMYADTYVNLPITPELSLQLATAITKLDIAPSRIDLGKLAKAWFEEGEKYATIDEFIAKKLINHID